MILHLVLTRYQFHKFKLTQSALRVVHRRLSGTWWTKLAAARWLIEIILYADKHAPCRTQLGISLCEWPVRQLSMASINTSYVWDQVCYSFDIKSNNNNNQLIKKKKKKKNTKINYGKKRFLSHLRDEI